MDIITLNIYGENDEILKTYKASRLRWKLIKNAIKIHAKADKEDVASQIESAEQVVRAIFPDITEEHLELADTRDIVSIGRQVINMLGGIQKNA